MTASPTPSKASALPGGRRIVLTTFGSLGDLHPFLALALEWQARGHQATIATHASHRAVVESAGVGFHAVRPDTVDFGDENAVMRRAMNLRTGAEYVIREMYLPRLRASYDDLTEAAQGADLLVTHTMAFAGPLVAAKQGIAWASATLAPISFFSVYDPPVLAPLPGLNCLRALGRVCTAPCSAAFSAACIPGPTPCASCAGRSACRRANWTRWWRASFRPT